MTAESTASSDGGPAAAARRPFDEDGTLNVGSHQLPPSEFVSEAFKAGFLRHLMSLRYYSLPPAMDAPKADWDRYGADTDQVIFAPSAQWSMEHYPTDIEDTRIAGVHVGIFTPKGGVKPENAHRVLINLHGGGFVVGRGLMAMTAESVPLATLAGIKIIGIDYRQSPYARFPAASEDVEAVYRELLKTHRPEHIGILGLSAGGTLATQSIAWFLSKGLPLPGAVGIFFATLVPPGMQGDSRMWNGVGLPGDPRFTITSISRPGGGYLEGVSRTDPLAFPGTSDSTLAQFPPTLLVSGTRSPDASPTIVAHAKLLELGVDSQLYIMEAGQHGAYVVGQYDSPEAHRFLSYVARWFGARLAK